MDKNQLYFQMVRSNCSPEELADLSDISVSIIRKALEGDEKALELVEMRGIKEVLESLDMGKTEGEPDIPEGVSCVREALPEYNKKRYTVEDYRALPEDERYELIDGELIRMDAPSVVHQAVSGKIYYQIVSYVRKGKGNCEVFYAPCDVQLDMDEFTMLQPDLFILCDQNKITKRCIFGAPDFVLEILSPSTANKDLKIKLRKYRLAGVKEYWAVDIEKRLVYVFRFEQSEEKIRMREKEKRFGITLSKEEEKPEIYGSEDIIPVGIYDGDLRIDMKEIFAKLRDV